MAKVNGIIHVGVGEELKPFRLDFNAVADLEELLGKGLNAILNEENMGFHTIRAFYWAGLKFKERGLTVTKAGHYVQQMLSEGRELEDLMKPITDALLASGIVKEVDTENVEEVEDDGSKN